MRIIGIISGMRLFRGMSFPAWGFLLGLGSAIPALPADLKPSTYSSLFSKSGLVAAGTVTGVSSGFLSGGRKARIEVVGLYKGRLRDRHIEVVWRDEDHPETGYADGAKVILFLVMRKDSLFAQAGPGISCWPVEKVAFGSGRPVRAVSYEFPLDLVSGVPKGAIRETEVVEKSLNFQVPKRKKWILVDALLPPMRPFKEAKPRAAKAPRKAPRRK